MTDCMLDSPVDTEGLVIGSGCDPLLDTDGDGMPNFLDLDSDDDGCSDAEETMTNGLDSHINTTDFQSVTLSDVDDCGLVLMSTDGICHVPTNDNWIDPCATMCPSLPDKDGDGVPDIRDMDDDNDGVVDTLEGVFCTMGTGTVEARLGNTYYSSISTNYPGEFTLSNLIDGNNGSQGGLANTVGANPLSPPAEFTITLLNPIDAESLHLVNDFGALGDGIDDFEVVFTHVNGSTTTVTGLSAANISGVQVIPFGITVESVIEYKIRVFTQQPGGGGGGNDFQLGEFALVGDLSEMCFSGLDTDGDGLTDDLDLDSDNDGIPDAIEAKGNISQALAHCMIDTTGSSVNYLMDPTTGCNTGIIDMVMQPRDTDGDGIPDMRDLDSDGDGCPDSEEAMTNGLDSHINTTEFQPVTTADVTDCGLVLMGMDSICFTPADTNWIDPCVTICPSLTDKDGDGVPDDRDLDDDGDGICDVYEGAGGDVTLGMATLLNPTTVSSDLLVGGVKVGTVVYESNGNIASPGNIANVGSQLDIIYVNDVTITITPEPNVELDLELFLTENGRFIAFNGANDNAGDFFVNMSNQLNGQPTEAIFSETSPTFVSNYNNGDVIVGSTPLLDQVLNGGTTNSWFLDISTDASSSSPFVLSYGAAGVAQDNSVLDFESVIARFDTDGDGISDHLDLDSDNDGIPDAIEYKGDITQALVNCMIDTTGSGSSYEIDPATGCSTGVIDMCMEPRDTDRDGVYDFRDLDSDNDGCSDAEEGTTDGLDSHINTTEFQPVTTTDVDDCGLVLMGMDSICFTPADTNWIDPCVTICPSLTDKDGDGIPDIRDLDDDNDGINDVDELQNICGAEMFDFSGLNDNTPDVTTYIDDRLLTTGNTAYPGVTFDFEITEVLAPAESNSFTDLRGNADGDLAFARNNGGSMTGKITFSEPISFVIDEDESLSGITGNTDHWSLSVTSGTIVYSDPGDADLENIDQCSSSIDFDVINGDDDWEIRFIEVECLTLEFLANANQNTSILSFSTCVVDSIDTDMDGIADVHDLDSDNDGIPDAVEKCGDINLQLINCMLDTTVAGFSYQIDDNATCGNGCSTGRIIGATSDTIADTDGDGVYDFRDLDSDGDCSNDADEGFVLDPDCDGLAGTGTPNVDECGRVIIDMDTICMIPPDTHWIDSLITHILANDTMTQCMDTLPGIIALSALFDTSGTNAFVDCVNFSFTSDSPIGASIANDSLSYSNIGCYGVIYEKQGVKCTLIDTSYFQVTEKPAANFVFNSDSICADGSVGIIPILTIPTYQSNPANITRVFSLVSGPATVDDPDTGTSTVLGEGPIILQMVEQISFPECGENPAKICENIIRDTIIASLDLCQTGLTCDSVDIMAPDNLMVDCTTTTKTLLGWLNSYTLPDTCMGCFVSNDWIGGMPDMCDLDSTKVIWTVKNACDSIELDSAYIISIPDMTAPDIFTCPEDFTVNVDAGQCDAVITYSTPLYNECGVIDTATYVSGGRSGSVFDLGPNVITYEATDTCGNTSTCMFTITVVDNVDPELQCPIPNVEVCNDQNSCSWISDNSVTPLGMEDCPSSMITHGVTGATTVPSGTAGSVSGTSFNIGTSVVTYTITDGSGNTSTCMFNVIVRDCSAPVINCPIDLTLECGNPSNAASITTWLAMATATDNCPTTGTSLTVTNSILGTQNHCGSTTTTFYEFRAEDMAGNVSVCRANVITTDTTDPTIETAMDLTIPSSAMDTTLSTISAWLGAIEGMDTCDPDVEVTHDFDDFNLSLCEAQTIAVTWTATDDCNNTATTTANLIITGDEVAPMISVPAALTIDCSNANISIGAWLASATATDACDPDVSLTNNYSPSAINLCGAGGSTTVTWTATDACGNSSMATQTITVTPDTTDPVLSVPDDLTLDCSNSNPNLTPALLLDSLWKEVSATDICDPNVNIDISLTSATIDMCSAEIDTIYAIVTASDVCNNEAVDSIAIIVIPDNVAPMALCCADFDFPVDEDGTAILDLDFIDCGSTDNCTNTDNLIRRMYRIVDGVEDNGVNGEFFEITSDDIGNQEIFLEVVDACGNADTCSVMVNVVSNPRIGLAKRVVNVEQNTDGSANVTYEFNIENYGDVAIDSIQLVDDLMATFAPCTDIEIISLTSDDFTINESYDGESDLNMLTGGDMLAVGDRGAVLLEINVDGCGTATGPFDNQAMLSGVTPDGMTITDLSTNGSDPDPDGNGNPDEEIPTPVSFSNEAVIGVSKRVSSGPNRSTEGCYDITFEIKVQNYGSVDLANIQVVEDLASVFGAGDIWNVVGIESEEFNVNPDFDGMGNNNLLLGNDILSANSEGNEGAIYLTVNVCPDGETDIYYNSVVASGEAPDGTTVDDVSQNGSDPDPDGNGNPDEELPTPFQLDCAVPTFLNCPRPAIVVDAPEGWCSTFANYSAPQAEAECGLDTIRQVDNSGLSSGDLFPVGRTRQAFVAYDIFGNASDTCFIDVIVNDFHTPPTISCPADIEVSSAVDQCSIVVDGIEPFDIEDNCPDNLVVLYMVMNEGGDLIGCGIDDAIGFEFPTGTNTVKYKVFDQPLLMISELSHDGSEASIEITNFGASSVDISGLIVGREGVNAVEITVPSGTILAPGDVFTQNMGAVGANDAVGYYIYFMNNQIDGVALYSYNASNFEFTGDISSTNIYRPWTCDTDSSDDWSIASQCSSGSFGMLNPGLQVSDDNGTLTSLQSEGSSMAMCSFTVTVLDEDPAYCAESSEVDYPSTDTPVTIDAGNCNVSVINVSDNFIVSDVNILDLIGTHPDVVDLSFTLTSPEGTSVTVLTGLCSGTADFDISLDDQSTNVLSSVVCGPLGNGDIYQPLSPLSQFIGENAQGDWILEIFAGTMSGSLEGWTLQLGELVPWSQTNVSLSNDEGQCSADYTYIHPLAADGCGLGTLVISFEDANNPTSPIPLPGGGVVTGGTEVTYTFAVGTTTVIYTLTDAAGNVSTCSFEVTVLDEEPPMWVDGDPCEDIRIELAPGECETTIDFPDFSAFAMDNCGIDTIIFSPDASFEFEIGTTEVTVTVIDEAGNQISCMFDVIIIEYETEGNTLACNNNINVSLNSDCEACITADMLLEGTYGCYDDFVITITDSNGVVIGSSTDETLCLGLEYVDRVVTATICTDEEVPNCCSVDITLSIRPIPEVIFPPDTMIHCNSSLLPDTLGYPEVISCEQELTINYSDEFIDYGLCDNPRAKINRIWTVTDESGNILQDTQMITIKAFDLEHTVFPPDQTIETALCCSDVLEDSTLIHPDNTGYPLINGVEIQLGSHGLCMVSWNWFDQKLFICDGSYEILRKWFVRDMCSPVENGVNPIEHYQIIKVLDKNPPIFTHCPSDVIISSNPWNCRGTYTIPDFSHYIKDDCGGVKQITVSVDRGTVINNEDGTFTLTNLVEGEHVVTIRVKDHCSNYAECDFTVTVEDLAPPQVVCIEELVVGLTADGTAKIFPENIDRGTFDGCSDINMQVYRMTDNCTETDTIIPADFVKFCCEDIGDSTIVVVLRAWDDADRDGVFGSAGDNYSECETHVRVEQKLPASIICPTPITINCEHPLDDLDHLGRAVLQSNCVSQTVSYQDYRENNDCSLGEILRVWTIDSTDVSCSQIIHVESLDAFYGDIEWPKDFEGTCLDDIPQLDPIVQDSSCDLVTFTVKSDTFNFSDDVCYKILRNFTVLDWCTYNPNSPDTDGVWTHTQVIKISDESAPEITSCVTVTKEIVSENCLQDIELGMTAIDTTCGINAMLEWTFEIDKDWDGQSDVEGTATGDSISITLEDIGIGSYTVVWTVKDGCGNTTRCNQELIVVDGKAPTPYCISDLVTVPMQGSQSVSVDAKDFNLSSSDNCTMDENLQYSFSGDSIVSSRVFSCDDILNGVSQIFELEMWVYDESGNKDFCRVRLEVQDNQDLCTDQADGNVVLRGAIYTEEQLNLMDVGIILQSEAPEYPVTDSTGLDGKYAFANNPIENPYEIIPSRNTSYTEGVSTLDLATIQKHILKYNQMTSPYKIIASDVNNDHKVSTLDLAILRKLILGKIDTLPNLSWRFVDSDHIFTDVQNPFPYPDTRMYEDLKSNVTGADFIAVKIGDVNASFDPSITDPNDPANRPAKKYELDLIKTHLENGRTRLEFRSSEEILISGLQTEIDFGYQIENIQSGLLTLDESNIYQPSENVLRVSWNDVAGIEVGSNQVFFSLEILAESISERDITVLWNQISPEIYVGKEIETRGIEIDLSGLILEDVTTLYQNEPNPFIFDTNIRFRLEKESEVTITIYNSEGKVFKIITDHYARGEHEETISSDIIPNGNGGVLYYKLETDDFVDIKKMIKLD